MDKGKASVSGSLMENMVKATPTTMRYEFSDIQRRVPDKENRMSESHFGDIIKESGEIHFSEVESHSLRALEEEVATSSQLDSYWHNMMTTLGERCLVEPITCIEAQNLVIIEVYGCTMRNSLKTLVVYNASEWWVPSDNGYKMGPVMRCIIKEIILGLVTIAKKQINFIPSLDSVVVMESQDYPPNSKVMFRSALEAKENVDPKRIWEALANLVDAVIAETIRVYGTHEVHPAVHHFTAMLSRDCRSADCGKMIEHPALLNDKEVLDFIMKFRDEARENTVRIAKVRSSLSYSFVGEWQADVNDWEKVIRKSKQMNAVFKFWKNDCDTYKTKGKDLSRTEPVRLAYFIQNMYQHIDTKKYKKDQIVYTFDDLPGFIDESFPRLASYLFGCYVKGETLFLN